MPVFASLRFAGAGGRWAVLALIWAVLFHCIASARLEAATPLQAFQAYLKAGNSDIGDVFGSSVAIFGDTAVVGAPDEEGSATTVNGPVNNFANSAGAAYVFVRSGTNWTQQAYLKARNGEAGDRFGWSVAISGDTIVVGAVSESGSATTVNGPDDNLASGAGAAYVFVRSGTNWTQQAYLKANNASVSDNFGGSVATSGDTIVVGALTQGASAGAAYVFVRSGTNWTQQAFLQAGNGQGGDFFGNAVAISSNTVVVGAFHEEGSATTVNGPNNNNAPSAGAAYVFERTGTNWAQQAYLKASNAEANDLFGSSVAISGDTIVVGAEDESGSATVVNGADNNNAPGAGAAYVFVRNGTTWTQQAYLKASNAEANDRFGRRVAISGDTVLVGAPGEDGSATTVNGAVNNLASASGAAYVFARSGTNWTQQAYLKANNAEAGDGFGISVAISGGTVLVGATGEDGFATTVNGPDNNIASAAGAAYVFESRTSPVITGAPSGQNVGVGSTVTLSVTATGTAPLNYQWRFNGVNIAGATNATLVLTNVQLANAGSYVVTVGNIMGSVTSQPVAVNVVVPPTITLDPVSQTNFAGEAVAFTVQAASSSPLTYQWRHNGTNLPGAVSDTLSIGSVSVFSAGDYSVVVANLAGAVISSNAVLAVSSGPVVLTPPAARIVNATAPVSFTVAALGDAPFTYQWRRDGQAIAGATAASFSIGAAAPSHEGLYSVVVSNALGSATSRPARLTVLPLSVVVPWAAAGGGPGTDVGNAIAVDAAGNSVVVGYFTGTATFGTNTLTSAGLTDIFLARYNAAGQVLWARRAGGPGYDAAKGVAVDAGGNIYVTGAYEGIADFGTNSLTNTTLTSYSDIFLARYDAAGNLTWVLSAGAEFAHDEGTAVAVDGAGNVLVAGRSVLETFAGAPVANAGRILVAKFTSAGAEVWAWKAGSYSGGNLDTATGVAGDGAGNVFVTGVFQSPLAAFGGGTFTNRGNADIFVAKLNAAGALQWARQAGGAGEDTASGVALAADGSAYVAGATGGAASFSGTNVTSLAGAYSDGFLAKYAGDGSVTWVRQFGGAGVAAARGVAVDAAGTVHLTGYFSGAASFGTNSLNGIIGSYDAFLSRLDAAGNVAFAQQAGGADLSGDFGLGVGVDGAGNSIITGYFSGTNSAGGTTLPSRGAEDVLLTRFNQFVGGGVPALGFQRIGAQLRMRWPLASSSYILQSATNLLAPVWVDETNTLNLSGTDLETDVPVGNKVRFYRLRKP